jgi:SOS response regulatory protein OraA/RecX
MDISQVELSKIANADIINWAVRYIQSRWISRPRSRKDFRMKLKMKMTKRYPNLEINAVWPNVETRLDELKLTDKEFTIWLVQQRKSQKKYGRRYVLSELRSEGISSDTIQDVLDKHWGDEDGIREEMLFKKFGVRNVKEIKDLKEKARIIRWLNSRGL